MNKKYLDTKMLAKRWHISPRTLANHRTNRLGAPYYKISGKILYDIDDVIELEEKNYFAK